MTPFLAKKGGIRLFFKTRKQIALFLLGWRLVIESLKRRTGLTSKKALKIFLGRKIESAQHKFKTV
jgi:hypothetical protein